jgi:hypothetical protein
VVLRIQNNVGGGACLEPFCVLTTSEPIKKAKDWETKKTLFLRAKQKFKGLDPACYLSILEVKSLKCGICGNEVDKQPMITAEGKCSVCGAKLKPA